MQSLTQFPFPNDFVHAVLVAHCAHITSKFSSDSLPRPGNKAQFATTTSLFKFFQQEKKTDLNKLIEDWKIEKIFHDPETQYTGIFYVKETEKQAVLVHRGMDLKKSLLKGLGKKSEVQASIEDILMGRIVDHQFYGYQETYDAIQFIKKNPNYNLSFAGHSFGSWLAQLSLFYCHTDFKFTNTKAITFDGPGSYEMMTKLQEFEVKGAGSTFKEHELDIVAYLSPPNFVNCSNKHIGNCYRLFPDIQSPEFLENKFVKFVTGSKTDTLMSIKGHDMKYILPFFDEVTGRPVCEKVIKWPSISHKNFDHSKEPLFKNTLSQTTKKHDGGCIINMLTTVGINLAKSVLSILFTPELITLGSLIYLFKDLFSEKISMDQFWIVHDSLDMKNQYRVKTNDLKTNFNLIYEGGYQVEPDDPYSRQIRDNIDEMLMNLRQKENHACIADQSFFTLVSSIRDRYDYSHSNKSLQIKEQFKSQITISQLRDLIRALDKDSFDEYMLQEKSLNCVFPRKVIEAGNNPLVRQNEMNEIRDNLRKNNAIAISGEPGFGKSTLAHCYALELEKSNIVPIEFNAAEGKIFDEYRNYAESLNFDIKDKNNEVILQLVNRELRQSKKQILLIYDNVDKLEDIVLYINNVPENAKLIITTRNFKLLEQHNMRIGAFTETDVQQYLKQSLPQITNNEVQETIQQIGCIPQNLAIMISYLKSNQSEGIKEYLNNPLKQDEKIYTKYFKIISEKEAEAWKLLQSLAYLDPDFVPLELIQRITDSKFLKSLCEYSLIGWVDKEGYRGVRIHREVQRLVKMYSTNNEQNSSIEGIFIQLLKIFDYVFPLIDDNPSEEWKKASLFSGNVKAFVQEIKSKNLERKNMLKLAKIYSYIGRFEEKKNCNIEKAKEYHEQALVMYQRLFPCDHHNVKISFKNVGLSYGSLGNNIKALELEEKALLKRQKLFPGDYPDVAISLKIVGIFYYFLGNLSAGIENQEKALLMYQRLFPGDHPDVANFLNNVGLSFKLLGNIGKAFEYQEKALLMKQKLFTDDHPDLATSLNDVGLSSRSLGHNIEALEYLEKALLMRQRLFPGDHPDVANSLNNVGSCFGSLHDNNIGLKYKERALMMFQRLFPGDHPYVSACLNDVGLSYRSLGHNKEALEYQGKAFLMRQRLFPSDHHDVDSSLDHVGCNFGSYKDNQTSLEYKSLELTFFETLALNDNGFVNIYNFLTDFKNFLNIKKNLEREKKILYMRRKNFAGDHHKVATSLNNVGYYLGCLGENLEALEYQEKSLEMYQRLFPGDHADVASSLNSVGSCFKSLGDNQRALEYQDKALLMRQRLFPGDHPDVATSLNNVGCCFESLSQKQKGLEYKEKALLMFQRLFPGDHKNVASSLDDTGMTYGLLDDYQKRLEYQEKALLMRQKLFPGDDSNVATSLNNVGCCYESLGYNKKALEYQEKALLMRQKLFSRDHPDVASSLNNVGCCYRLLGDTRKGLKYQEEALLMRQRLFPGDHHDVASSFNNVGCCFRSLGYFRIALYYLDKALLMRQKLFPGDHPDIANSLNNVGCCFGSLGKNEKALEYQEKALLMRQRLFPGDHPDVASSLNNVGCCFKSFGDHQKALEYQEKALLMRQKLFPDDNPDVANSLINVGCCFESLRENQLGIEYKEKALLMFQRLFPGDHPDVAKSLNELGLSFGLLNDNLKALEIQEKALIMREGLFPADHPDVAVSLKNVGNSYYLLGDRKNAIQFQEKAFFMRQRLFPGDHPDVANSLYNVGNLHYFSEDFKKALEYEEKAFLMYQRLFPGDHLKLATYLNNFGLSFKLFGNIKKSLEYQEKALFMRQQLKTGDHPDVVNSLNDIGNSYHLLGDTKIAQKYELEALLMHQRLFPGDHPDVASSLNEVGLSYRSLGYNKKALEYQEKALLMRQRLFPGNHPDVANSLNNVGCCFGSLGDNQKALEYQEKALLMRQSLFTDDHPDVATSLSNIGNFFYFSGEISRAREYQEKALLMRQKLFPGNHPDLANSLINVGCCFGSSGDNNNGLKYKEVGLKMFQQLFPGDHPYVASSLDEVGLSYSSLRKNKIALEYQEKALLMRHRLFPADHPDVANSFNNVGLSFKLLGDFRKSLYYLFQAYSIKKQLDLPFDELSQTINFLLLECEVTSPLHTLWAKLNLLVSATVFTKDLFSLKLLLKPESFILVQKNSAKKGRKSYENIDLKFTKEVDHFISTEQLKEQLGSDCTQSNIEEARMLYFEAICLGIVFSDKQNLECAFEFAKKFPELLIRIAKEHPDYFVDKMIVTQLKSHELISEQAYALVSGSFK